MRVQDIGRSGNPKEPTVFDRVAVAFASGLITFVLASLVWFGLVAIFYDFAVTTSFAAVLLLSGAMAVLGFALRVNPVIAAARWQIRALMSWV